MIAAMKLDGSVGAVLAGVRRINVYLQEVAPWKLAKEPGNEEKIAACLYTAAECLRVCAALLYPVMPEKMAILDTERAIKMFEKLGINLQNVELSSE